MSLFSITCRNTVKSYLQEQRQLKDSGITKAHTNMGTHERCIPGALCTICRQLNMFENLFQAAELVLGSSAGISISSFFPTIIYSFCLPGGGGEGGSMGAVNLLSYSSPWVVRIPCVFIRLPSLSCSQCFNSRKIITSHHCNDAMRLGPL